MADELAVPVPPPAELSLDVYVDLLADDRECSNMIDFWTKRRELIRKKLTEVLGENEVGLVNGEEAFTYMRQDRFNTTAFKKKYPNLWKAYTVTRPTEMVDVELLRKARPDIYREFQVRAVRNTYEPPGSTA